MKRNKIVCFLVLLLMTLSFCIGGCSPKKATEEESSMPPAQEKNTFTAGDTLVYENLCEITWVSDDEITMLAPTDPGITYNYYEAKEDHVYLHIKLNVKNISSEAVHLSDMISVYATYRNKYRYVAFSVLPEKGEEDFLLATEKEIPPLVTTEMHALIEVDKRTAADKKKEFSIEVAAQEYTLAETESAPEPN
ncbi:MAG: hypothetical protein ACOX3W_05240 [Christensenellaceae bacterium]